MFSVVDNPFSSIVCVVAPKVQEGHVAVLIHECSMYVPNISFIYHLVPKLYKYDEFDL